MGSFSIDLTNQTSALMIASDVFAIVSATIQILGIVARWIVAAKASAAAVSSAKFTPHECVFFHPLFLTAFKFWRQSFRQ